MKSKMFFLTISFSFLIYGFLLSQNVSLLSQADVNSFDSSMTMISGNLTIKGSDISDLKNLRNISFIKNDLVIKDNPILSSINDMSSLDTIGGSFDIVNNPLITNLDSLSGLSSIRRELLIRFNPLLLNLDGLTSVTSLKKGLIVSDNESLMSLAGLSSLTYVGSMTIGNNPNLESLDGLSGITEVDKNLHIIRNDIITDVDGLSSVLSAGSIQFSGNTSLTNIDGILNITKLQKFIITDNPLLSNIDAAKSITLVASDLFIGDNESLSNCCGIQDLLINGIVGGTVSIWGNPVGCSNKDEVISEDCTVGILTSQDDFSILVYPNPVSNELSIEYPEKYDIEVRIIDQVGRTIMYKKNKHSINVDQISAGLYFVEVKRVLSGIKVVYSLSIAH